MITEYTIYGKLQCPSCDTAEQLLKLSGSEYTKLTLGIHYNIIELFEVVPPSVRNFPVILKDGKYLGGLKELKTELGVE